MKKGNRKEKKIVAIVTATNNEVEVSGSSEENLQKVFGKITRK